MHANNEKPSTANNKMSEVTDKEMEAMVAGSDPYDNPNEEWKRRLGPAAGGAIEPTSGALYDYAHDREPVHIARTSGILKQLGEQAVSPAMKQAKRESAIRDAMRDAEHGSDF